jgi:hypothetical protein
VGVKGQVSLPIRSSRAVMNADVGRAFTVVESYRSYQFQLQRLAEFRKEVPFRPSAAAERISSSALSSSGSESTDWTLVQ